MQQLDELNSLIQGPEVALMMSIAVILENWLLVCGFEHLLNHFY
jgi:hypothetical protein